MDDPLTALRKIYAIAHDYLSHDFPVSTEEMCVEFTEVIEEISALAEPIVEASDDDPSKLSP